MSQGKASRLSPSSASGLACEKALARDLDVLEVTGSRPDSGRKAQSLAGDLAQQLEIALHALVDAVSRRMF